MRELLLESPADCGYRYAILVDEMSVGGVAGDAAGCGGGLAVRKMDNDADQCNALH